MMKIVDTSFRFLKVRDVKSPERGTQYSAGIDFFVPNDFVTCVLAPGEDVLIPSGLKVGLPPSTMLMGADKSGIASSAKAKTEVGMEAKDALPNSAVIIGAKIIDEDYPGEVHIHLINAGRNPVIIKPGQKVAQFIIVPVLYSIPEEVKSQEELRIPQTERTGGFSSTNK